MSTIGDRENIRRDLRTLIDRHFEQMPELPPESCPLAVPLYGAQEVADALDVLLDQSVTMGARVRAFESRFADHIGVKHAVMLNSGSSANLVAIAVLASGRLARTLRPGDEVIVPAVTWPTTISPIIQAGGVPVLVDVDEHTLNLDVSKLADAISPKTRGVFLVHLLGNPVDIDSVNEVLRGRDIWMLEDACESLGSSVGGKQVGSFGLMGTFSFYFSHHITTIEGGMLVTDDDSIADLARSLRAHGWTRDMATKTEFQEANPSIDERFLFVNVGYNLRPMELQAAIGLVQLDRLEEFNERRRANAHYLIERLASLTPDVTFVTEQDGGRSTWFGFAVMLRDGATRRRLSSHLEARGIETRPIVAGNLAMQPAFRDSPHRAMGSLRGATTIAERGLFIGNHPSLTEAHLEHIAKSFHDFFAH